jgi:hypothetical protein
MGIEFLLLGTAGTIKSAFELITPHYAFYPKLCQNCEFTLAIEAVAFPHAEMFESAAFLHLNCILYTFGAAQYVAGTAARSIRSAALG